MFTAAQRMGVQSEAVHGAAWQWACALRCAIPGVVVSFDPQKQTCVVQPAIQEMVNLPPATTTQGGDPGFAQNIPSPVSIDPLQDVPIIMPRAGGWAITFPIVPGTECLLIFGDMCIDGWWQSGGVQPQFDRRRHDLSDAFALFGPWSQPRVLSDYSTSSMQIRSDDGSVVIDLSDGEVSVTAPNVVVNASATASVQAPAITAGSVGGPVMPVMSEPFLAYFAASILPFLQSRGYIGPEPPASSITTVLQAE